MALLAQFSVTSGLCTCHLPPRCVSGDFAGLFFVVVFSWGAVGVPRARGGDAAAWLAQVGLKAVRANSHSGSLREGEVIGTRFLRQITWEL